jgi:hypothetical protein
MEVKPQSNTDETNLENSQDKSTVIKSVHVYESIVLPPSSDDVPPSKVRKRSRVSRMFEKLTKKVNFNGHFEMPYTLEKAKQQNYLKNFDFLNFH